MSAVATGYAIERVDLDGASDEAVRPHVELAWAMDREAIPEDPPQPFESMAARMRTPSTLFKRWRWAAFTPDRRLGGYVWMGHSTQDNLHVRDFNLRVHPEDRRRGIGRALLREAVRELGAGEGLLAMSWTRTRVPAGIALAEKLGATPGLRMRASQLELAKVDRELMQRWAALDPEGYRLEWIDAEAPDHLLPNVITAYVTMNSMPREDLQVEDWKITPESVREWERLARERGERRRLLLAIAPSGETAGYTEISFDERERTVLHQLGTAVVPEHRGRGIGKWVKGRMVERILAEMPDARHIRTENAGSNAAMLAINVAMGFAPAWEQVLWQIPVPELRRALDL